MAQYRIICTTQEPPTLPNDRAHIVAVGTGSSASAVDKYWLLSEVLAAMDAARRSSLLARGPEKLLRFTDTCALGAQERTSDRVPMQWKTTIWTTYPDAHVKKRFGPNLKGWPTGS